MMILQKLAEALQDRLTRDLPGAIAHNVMRARATGKIRPRVDLSQSPRQGGVLILLYEAGGEVFFPLIKRPDYEGTHGGQVSLPGGKAEQDESVYQTAVREAEEEIGVDGDGIAIIGRLSDFHVFASNFVVAPVVGVATKPLHFTPDPIEVARIFSASITDLLREDAVKETTVTPGGFELIAPYFEVDGEVVWGATAMILNEFRSVLTELNL